MDNKIVVGHSLQVDFENLNLDESQFKCQLRDVSDFVGYQKAANQQFKQKRKLRELAKEFLNAEI